MISAGNRTDDQDFTALRGVFARGIGMIGNMAPNPQESYTFEIWTFGAENHKITIRKPAESMHFRSP